MPRAATTTDAFNAIAEPRRREIIDVLVDGKTHTVGEMVERLRMPQPAVSKHLGVLKDARLVRDRPEGRQTHYSAEPKGIAPLIDWLKHCGEFWRDRLDRLGDLLERMDR